MFKNEVITAIRSFSASKLVILVNIVGLAVGITCGLLVFSLVRYELSIDQFHHKIDRLYRLVIVGESRDQDRSMEYRSDIIQDRVRVLRNFPEIENIVRLMPWPGKVEHKTGWIRENRFWFSDPHVFDMLTLPLKRGYPETVLQTPYSVVITPAMAAKYFGKENPIGKTISLHMSVVPAFYTFTVTGILDSHFKSSSMKIDFLAHIPFEKLTQDRREVTGNLSEWVYVLTFIELVDPSAYSSLQAKLGDLYCHDVDKTMSLENMKYRLEPLRNSYLKSEATFFEPDSALYFGNAMMRPIDRRLLAALTLTGVVILLISFINFINFAAVHATLRGKVGRVRKATGLRRRQPIVRLAAEILIMSSLALVLALIFTERLLPSFNMVFERETSFSCTTDWKCWLGMAAIPATAGLLSGIWAAFFLSSPKPSTGLKGLRLRSPSLMRKVLVTTQIGACAAAFLCSLMMRNAMNDLKTKDIGFNSRNLIFFQLDDKELVERYPAFKKEILRIPGVSHMTASNFVPWQHGLLHSLAYYNDDAFLRALTMYVDPSFIETYQIPIIDGEGFSTKWTEMPGYVIINETARKILQSAGSDPLSKVIDIPYGKSFWPHQTLGIMRDFYYFYPTERIKPLAILPSYHIRYVRNYVTIRLADGSHGPILAKVETAVKRFFPHTRFEYKYVAEEMEKMHTRDMGYHWIAFVVVNGFLLLIAVAGLSGYAAYEINRCTREIGIRKAFGAKAVHIVLHFFLRFAKLVLIANAIAWPICYFAIQWILVIIDYPHPIRISFIHFLMAGIFTMFFTVATVGVQVYRAALIDPAETLRYENNE